MSILASIIDFFLKRNVTPFLIIGSLALGVLALVLTPREEEPQIVVPMADVMIRAPGLSVGEVERQVATPLEKIFAQIDGVEHVYSVSLPGRAVVTVRFYVGEDREASLVKLYNKIYSNTDRIPKDVSSWVVKPVEIDDVPIVIVTLWSDRPDEIDDYRLRRIAGELETELKALPETNRTEIVGGRPRQIRILLDPDALAAHHTSALEVAWALGVSNRRMQAGGFDRADRHIVVEAGEFFPDAAALKRAVVNVVDGRPVFLDQVAEVVDGPAERRALSWIGFGAAERGARDVRHGRLYPAVHIAVAKQKGTNAVAVAARIEKRLAELEPALFPPGVHARITRDYGETANDKVNELLEGLLVALVIVVALFAWSLGWREGLVVATAVPITFALTLMINYWAGYTINRVTLFALILSLGLVVDDPVVDVENIYRHLRARLEPPLDAVRTAVNEVRPPILLATLAVIVSFLPMYLITGMMGPYMSPMALNVPVAMAMSMFVAFTITPWLSYRVLKGKAEKAPPDPGARDVTRSTIYRRYERLIAPFIENWKNARNFLIVLGLLFGAAALMAALRLVQLKMLPFDNKNEFQILVNPPEGTTLERTDAIARALGEVLRRAREVKDFEIYTGTASPMDFNGMVRHYYLREGPNVADIRVNLLPKKRREQQSHEITLRLRRQLEQVAREEGARIQIVEVPPGPPVLATVTAEIYGEPDAAYETIRKAALATAARLAREPGVHDVDTTVEDDAPRLVFVTDKEKAALSGIATEDIADTVRIALAGAEVGRLHDPHEAAPLPIRLEVTRAERAGVDKLAALTVKGRPGIVQVKEKGGVRAGAVPVARLGELGRFVRKKAEKAIYHKDLKRVAYVYAEPVGRAPAAVVADVEADRQEAGEVPPPDAPAHPRPLSERSYFANGGGDYWSLPRGTQVEWLGEGELNITKDVFRDLGIAFGVALVGIYMILVYQTASYAMPLILMISIPLTMIGIMPGFWLLNRLTGAPIDGFANPTFFTATAMIGMIALSGIAVRNAILLIEFLHVALARGHSLREAVCHAGAVRTRPILLTAGPAMLAAIPITLDPVFSGLAWALIFGLFVSTAFTLLVVPMTYYWVYHDKPGHGLPKGVSVVEELEEK
ncbi:MAG: efflux RND transporter permease subunit [Alphaproteobacteria bacterium]|nr:MAG: efflux RND transporter permease subunit [Alphaproteobacteria bacterium]